MSGRRRGARRAALVALVASIALATLSAAAPAAWTWTPAQVLDLATYDRAVATVIDADGNATAVWESGPIWSSPDRWQMWSSTRPAGGTWSAPVQLAPVAGTDQRMPQLAVDPSGTVTAVWAQGRKVREWVYDATIQAAVKPSGGAWQAPVTIGTRAAGVSDLDLATDADGNTAALWRGTETTDYFLRVARRPVGGAWLAEEQAVTPSNRVFDAEVATRDGDVAVVWSEGDPYGYPHGVYRTAGGGWSAPERFSDDLGSDMSAAIDGSGEAIAVWHGSDTSHDPDGEDRIGVARRPAGGGWSTGWLGDGADPAIASNGPGDVAVSWSKTDYDAGTARHDTRLKLRPSGGPWQSTEVVDGGASDGEHRRQLVFDDQGAVTYLANVHARHREPDGTWGPVTNLTWNDATPGRQLPAGFELGPALAGNATGDLVVGFQVEITAPDAGIALMVSDAPARETGGSEPGGREPGEREPGGGESGDDPPAGGDPSGGGDPPLTGAGRPSGDDQMAGDAQRREGGQPAGGAPQGPAPVADVPSRDTIAPRTTRVVLGARTVSLRLSESATVSIAIDRCARGRASRARRSSSACRQVTRIEVAASAGARTVRLRKPLAPGRYRVRITAGDAAGNVGRASRLVTLR